MASSKSAFTAWVMVCAVTVCVQAQAIAGETVLLDFYADWCGPCRQMDPVVAGLKQAGYPVRKVDIDREPALAAQYSISSIPCFVMLVDGREVDRQLGPASPQRLQEMLRRGAGNNGAGNNPSASSAGASNPRPATGTPGFNPSARPYPVRSNSPLVSIEAVHAIDPASLFGPPPGSAPIEPPHQPAVAQVGPAVPTGPMIQTGPVAQSAPWNHEPRPDSHIQPASFAPQTPFAAQPPFAAQTHSAPPTHFAGQEPFVNSSSPSADSSIPAAADWPSSAMAASVRLRIEDGSGASWGSGTVIDSADDEALILTCGHVFREGQGRGRVTVDLFGPGMPHGLVGQVLSYDVRSEVGLLRVDSPCRLPSVRVAPPGHRVKPGDPVFTVGCNGGADPTLQSTRVTALDKYLGSPNLEVAGQPVQGRSGGGLFSTDGYLIGVCYAADKVDDEGLCSALPAVHALMDKTRLGDLYAPLPGSTSPASPSRPFPETSPQAPPGPPTGAPIDRPSALPSATFVSAPRGQGPLSRFGERETPDREPPAATSAASAPSHEALASAVLNAAPPGVQPASFTRSQVVDVRNAAFDASGKPLSEAEQAALSVLRERSEFAEVICIVRPLSNPRAKSEIIVLDRASPEFMRRLASERQTQSGRALTSFDSPRPAPSAPLTPVHFPAGR